MTPEEYKRKALDQLAVAKDPYDRGTEAPLNELSGLGVDVLREPKEQMMKSAGPGRVQDLINMLMPEEIGLPTGMLEGKAGAGLAMAGAGIIKPKTKAKDLMTKGLDIWDKDKIGKEILDNVGGKEVPMWKKKMLGK